MAGIQEVRRRPVKARALQFDGKNSKEVAEFVRENGEEARAGGRYVTITTDKFTTRARQDDWVVVDSDGEVSVYSHSNFLRLFTTGKK